MKRIHCLRIVALLVGWGVPAICYGQATGSAITGVVRDASQAVVTRATVTVTNVETGISRSRETDSAGRYRVGELQPGSYQVTVSMEGFNKETRQGIPLLVGQEIALNFVVQVGAVTQEVVVTGEAPLVQTSTAELAGVVAGEQLRELPLNGRSFTDLITLDAQAVQPTNASTGISKGTTPQLTVAGARSDYNSFLIDGTDMGTTNNMTPGSAAGVQLGVDTIREYKVITTNPKAEYGRTAGAVVTAVTRGGTNQFQGSVFEFLRNDAMDARKFFDLGEPRPFKRNQFGGSFGGPVRRDHTFFFLAYEGLRERLNTTTIYNVPTAAGRLGVGILQSGETVDPRIVPYISLYPLPNGQTLGQGIAEYSTDTSQPTYENYGSARLDHHFSSNDFVFGRYTVSKGGFRRVGALLSAGLLESSNHYITFQYDRVFSPVLLHTFRAGLNISRMDDINVEVEGTRGLAFVPGKPMGSIGATGLSSVGGGGGAYHLAQGTFQFEDSLTYTRGPHTMKFGGNIQRFRWNTDNPNLDWGSITFSDLRNFLLAGPTRTNAELVLPESSSYRHMRTTMLGFFAQDDYQITSNLTLNFGLRWEFTTGMTETDDKLSYLSKGWILTTINDLGIGELYKNHIRNFQPRLGFNWAMGEAQKTVVSGGVGIFHNQLLHNVFISSRAQVPFYFRATSTNFNASRSFPNLKQMILDSGRIFRETRQFDYENFKTPTLYRYNLTLQRELPGQMAVRASYVGSIGRHLARRTKMNIWPWPVQQPDGSLFFPPEPVPQLVNADFDEMNHMQSDVNSVYNALALNLNRRFAQGLTFQVSYSYSKSIDHYSQSESNFGGTPSSGQFDLRLDLERARSSFNVPHVFVVNGIYELPLGASKPWLNSGGVAATILGGWQVGGILTLQHGVPFSVTSSAATTGYRFAATRPNLKPGVDVNELTQEPFGTPQKYFDPTAFSVPPAGTLGNAGRGLLLGPGLKTLTFSLSKVFPLGETKRLQFRGEFFNLLNHPNFGLPQARVFRNFNIDPSTGQTAIDPTAGRITSVVGTARQIQLGLKLTF